MIKCNHILIVENKCEKNHDYIHSYADPRQNPVDLVLVAFCLEAIKIIIQCLSQNRAALPSLHLICILNKNFEPINVCTCIYM